MLKRFLRITGMLLVFSILFSTVAFATEVSPADSTLVEPSASDIKIEELLDERASILNQLFSECTTDSANALLSELNEIDLALSRLGVAFLSDSQVNEMFPETKNNKTLSLSGQTQLNTGSDTVQPMVDTPESTVNTWTTYRSSYSVGGVVYSLQRLIAQPSSASSPLANSGTRTVTFSNNWKAGSVNAISSVAKSITDGVLGTVPGASIALSFYDAVKSYVTGISTTTEVDVPHIAYSWSNVTTAAFTYVRLNSQSDYYQWLSLISTKTETAVAYSIPTFKNASGATISPTVIQGSRTITATPTNYNSSDLAISVYNSVSGEPIHNCVSYIQISGPESKSVQKISPCYPSMPIYCEP